MRLTRALPFRLAASLLLGAVCTLGVACSDAPSKEQCNQLLEHLIDIEMKAGGSDGELTPEMKDDLAKQRKQVIEFAAGQKFLETCTQKTPKKVVECGLAAKTAEAVAKCDDGK